VSAPNQNAPRARRFLKGSTRSISFDEVFRWVTQTETGDRAELSNLPENLPFLGATSMRDRIPASVRNVPTTTVLPHPHAPARHGCGCDRVNHHLFFADLALRNGAYGAVLPDYAAGDFSTKRIRLKMSHRNILDGCFELSAR